MLFETKLKKILKNETIKLIIFIILPLLLVPFFIWLIDQKYNDALALNLIGVFLIYLLLMVIAFKKVKIVKDLKWALSQYMHYPQQVHQFLISRKASLASNGQYNLCNLYDEALQSMTDDVVQNDDDEE